MNALENAQGLLIESKELALQVLNNPKTTVISGSATALGGVAHSYISNAAIIVGIVTTLILFMMQWRKHKNEEKIDKLKEELLQKQIDEFDNKLRERD